MIGTILGGRYEILEEIGKGGMAYVYKAHCHMLNRTVAVKVLRNDLEGGDEFIQRFNIEAQSAAGLTHPNIVSIYDVGEDNGYHYIVMEYIEGITLKEYIKEKGSIDNYEAANIAAQICSALEAAHEKNIVHRDIKPHNIMITSDNRVKVTDFGIARASSNSTMQVGDNILGSVHYISPEQARGGYVDCKSDIYSLGIVLYEMLTGRVPFESESPIAVAMKHLEEKPVNPRDINPDISEELQEIVIKAMCKETRNRYQSVSAMRSDLEAIMPKLRKNLEENDDNDFVSDDTKTVKTVNGYHSLDDDDYSGDEEPDDEYSEDEDGDYDEDDYDDYDDGRKKHSAANMVFVAVLIAFLLVGGVSVGVTYILYPDLPIFNLFSNTDITVPDFVGMKYSDAEKKARSMGLNLEIGDRVNSAKEADTIVEQVTAKGRKVKKGETLLVYVSAGPGKIDLEEYVGMDYEDVAEKLKAKGYEVTTKKKSDTEVEKGKIISISQNGSKITMYVSKGYDDIEVVVPNIVGKKLAVAEQLLHNNTLTVGKIEKVESDIYDEGTVINQSIASGEKVTAKTAVDIKVAGKSTSSENENKVETPSGNKTSSRTLSIGLPSDRASVSVKVVAKHIGGNSSEEQIFNSTVNTAEQQELVLKVSGSSKVEYSIYFDGALVSTKVIDFAD